MQPFYSMLLRKQWCPQRAPWVWPGIDNAAVWVCRAGNPGCAELFGDMRLQDCQVNSTLFHCLGLDEYKKMWNSSTFKHQTLYLHVLVHLKKQTSNPSQSTSKDGKNQLCTSATCCWHWWSLPHLLGFYQPNSI